MRVARSAAVRLLVDREAADDDAVVLRGRLAADEAAEHVGQHLRGRPVVRMAMAAAAAGLEAEDVAALAAGCRRRAARARAPAACRD